MKEHEKHAGYYHLPFINKHLLINRAGHIFDCLTGKDAFTGISTRGYPFVSVKIASKHGVRWRNKAIHRLLAIYFVPKPDRHHDKDFSDLQVNHIDGVKTNYALSNLEWVTGKENMEHARLSGLFDNEKIVLSRDIRNGTITEHKSLSECARINLLPPAVLSNHLNSISFGRITRDWLVFKFKDSTPWPVLFAYECKETTLGCVADVIGENIHTGEIILDTSLVNACYHLGLNANVVRNNRSRKGFDSPTSGWVFYPLSDYLKIRSEFST